MRALAATAAALTVAVIGPLLLVGALIGGITAVGGAATAAGALDPAKIPPLARELLPRITTITATSCPQLPPLWVVAEIQAESGWNPTAFSADRNGGAAGLYQLDQANWTTAGGQPWRSIPPPAHADVFAPVRHLELAIPFLCANLRTMAAHLAATAKPTPALDAMLVCHIAGCDRVTRSASGIPAAGEAGCDTHCAGLVANYLTAVHRYLADYAAPAGPANISTLPAPVAFTGTSSNCSEPDPTTQGCLTPATRHTLQQVLSVFGTPGPNAALRSVTCWDPHPQNPHSDHPKGRLRLLSHQRRHVPHRNRPRQRLEAGHLAPHQRRGPQRQIPHLAGPLLEPRNR